MENEKGAQANSVKGAGKSLAFQTNFTLSVTVFGGELPPTDIKVILDGPGAYHQVYSVPQSFSKSESLPGGPYDLIISGSNPHDGYTEILLNGDFVNTPHPSKTAHLKDKKYYVVFSFFIA